MSFAHAVQAQYDNIWYFGRWAGLDFSSGSPVALTNSAMFQLEGSTVMCDVDGNLLFYSNGVRVWNRNHVVMENGTGLLGHNSSSQSGIVVPKPGDPMRYYLFVTDAEGRANGLSYSEIDMAAAGGLGSVVNKNIRLVTPVCEKVAATYHANGTDIWVTTHHWGSNAFYSYLVTAAGVNPVPVISNAGAVTAGANNSGRYAGYMAISPDGRKLAMANVNINIELFDFNAATGEVSNPLVLRDVTGSSSYGIEFSPNSNVLYATFRDNVVQYNLSVANIPASETVIAALNYSGAIKIGPDGKIYIINRPLETTLSVIHNPDVIGTGCNFEAGAVNLSGRQTLAGLPAYLSTPLYLTGLSTSDSCSGNSISFSFTSTITPDSIEWDFGDGTTTTGSNPSHTYTSAGTYLVKAKARKNNMVRFITRTVIIHQNPQAAQPDDISVCDDDNDGVAIFDLTTRNAQILGGQDPTVVSVTYHSSQADALSAANPLPGEFLNTVNPQAIYARVTNTFTGCYAITSFLLVVRAKPEIDLDDRYVFCSGNTMQLSAPPGFDGYLWSTGATTRTITAAPGQYTVTVFTDYNGFLCDASATMTVVKSAAPVIREIKTYDWTDHNNSIHIIAEGPGNYEYSIDGIAYQPSPVFSGLEPGVYKVYVKDLNGCGQAEDEAALLMYPKYFTPNGDGHHETWRIKFGQYEPQMTVYIFDRYGKLITSFKGTGGGWDGKYNGYTLPSTDYWFVAIRQNGREHKGHFSMLR